MPPSIPASSIDAWAARLQATLAHLPALPQGQVRLYRIQDRHPIQPVSWLHQALVEQGALLGRGRWFTFHPHTLAFYAQDTPDPELRMLTMSRDLAQQWTVANLPAHLPDGSRPRAFSRDPAHECFLPRELANQAQVLPWQAPRPRRRP